MKKALLIIIILFAGFKLDAQIPEFLWETDAVFSGPESVVYDPNRDLLYVSNLKKNPQGDIFYGTEFISKVNMKGEVLELKWIEDLTEPTGLCIFNDQLLIVERFGLVFYDLKNDRIAKKIRIHFDGFLNDVTVGDDSTIYVSESSTQTIYSIKDKEITTWYSGGDITKPNGILFSNGQLFINVNGDSTIKSIDVKTKAVSKVAQMKKGIIDGIKNIEDDLLISFLEGNLYRVTMDGKITEILNTRRKEIDMADIEYIESKKIVIIPAIWQHKVVAFKLK